jgi:hypothetical protein
MKTAAIEKLIRDRCDAERSPKVAKVISKGCVCDQLYEGAGGRGV